MNVTVLTLDKMVEYTNFYSVEIDGIIYKVAATLVYKPNRANNAREREPEYDNFTYRINFENSLVKKHPEYREIRNAILTHIHGHKTYPSG